MEMFFTLLVSSAVVMALCYAAFAGVTRDEKRAPEVRPEADLPVLRAQRFFAADAPGMPAPPRVPIELLLSQIEHHVRLEQAAAEGFLNVPTAESLHSKTSSPLVN